MTVLFAFTAFAGGAVAAPAPVPSVEVTPLAPTAVIEPGNLFTYVARLEHSKKGVQAFGRVPPGKYAVYVWQTAFHTFEVAAGDHVELSCTPFPRQCTVRELAPTAD